MKAHNLTEALEFFLENHTEPLVCVVDGVEQVANCYPEAEQIFNP